MNKDRDSFGNQYLYAEDLLHAGEFKAVQVEIAKYHPAGSLKAKDGKVIDKPVIGFAGRDKLLVLCRTNERVLHYVCGSGPGADGSGWVGKRITLQPRIVDAFGERVVAIRVIPPAGCTIRKALLKGLGAKAEWHGGA